jgi:hypothetical protein
MNLARTPQPQFRRTPRHRAGRRDARPAIELLAAHSLQPGPSDALTASARHAAPTDEPGQIIDAATAGARAMAKGAGRLVRAVQFVPQLGREVH